MGLLHLLPQRAVATRYSAQLLAASALPFSTAVSRTDDPAFLVKLRGVGLAGTASVTITGELNGVSQTEVVAVSATAPSIGLSKKSWTKVTQIATASAGAGTIRADAVTTGGDPVYAETAVGTIAGRLRQRSARVRVEGQGAVQEERFRFYTTTALQAKDRLALGGVVYEVEHVVPVYGASAVHHYESELHRVS